MHRLSNDVKISWFFLWFIVLTLSLNLNTLYVVMTSSKPRHYLSHVVHFLKVLTHRLPLRLTEPTVTQFFTITTDSKLSPHRPVPCSLYPPINGHCTNHRIADPQTKIQTYSTTKNKQTNKQYTTNIIIIIIPLFYTSLSRHTNPYLCIMHTAKHT